jgi:hypothetical protein
MRVSGILEVLVCNQTSYDKDTKLVALSLFSVPCLESVNWCKMAVNYLVCCSIDTENCKNFHHSNDEQVRVKPSQNVVFGFSTRCIVFFVIYSMLVCSIISSCLCASRFSAHVGRYLCNDWSSTELLLAQLLDGHLAVDFIGEL